jgi:hypothetical protein
LAAEVAPHVGEESLDVGEARHVGDGLGDRRQEPPRLVERGAVHVADVHARPVVEERPGDRAADAGRAGGHEHAQALRGCVHRASLGTRSGAGV